MGGGDIVVAGKRDRGPEGGIRLDTNCVNLHTGGIDGGEQWRYSQAQIPDLVANANPTRIPTAHGQWGAYALQAQGAPRLSPVTIPSAEPHRRGDRIHLSAQSNKQPQPAEQAAMEAV